MSVGEPVTEIVCGECGGVSTPPTAIDIHNEGCSKSLAAKMERGEQITVDGEPALFKPESSILLIPLTTDELIGNVATMEARVIEATKAHKKTGATKKDAEDDLRASVAALTQRYASDHGQLSLIEVPAEPADEDDAEDEAPDVD